MDYTIEFHMIATESRFFYGLSERLKDHFTPLDLPSELDGLFALASKIDKRRAEREATSESHLPSGRGDFRVQLLFPVLRSLQLFQVPLLLWRSLCTSGKLLSPRRRVLSWNTSG